MQCSSVDLDCVCAYFADTATTIAAEAPETTETPRIGKPKSPSGFIANDELQARNICQGPGHVS